MLTAEELIRELSGGFRSATLESYNYTYLKRIFKLKESGIDTSIFQFVYSKSLVLFLEEGYNLEDYMYFKDIKNVTDIAIKHLYSLIRRGLSTEMFEIEGITYPPMTLAKLATLEMEGTSMWYRYDYKKYTDAQLVNLINWHTSKLDVSDIPDEYLCDITIDYNLRVSEYKKTYSDYRFLVKYHNHICFPMYIDMCSKSGLNLLKFEKILTSSKSVEQLQTNLGVLLTTRKLRHNYVDYQNYVEMTYGDLRKNVQTIVNELNSRAISSNMVDILTECVAKGLPKESITEGVIKLLTAYNYRNSNYEIFNLWVRGADLDIILNMGYTIEEIEEIFKLEDDEIDEAEKELRKTYVWSYVSSNRHGNF